MIALRLLAALALLAAVAAAQDEPPRDPELLYKDKSWQHIGDNNFSPDSNSASDLTLEAAGTVLEVTFVLDDRTRATLADESYRTVLLTGEAIGNDTGKFGDTTATIVEVNGTKVGEIVESGRFAIRFPKALVRPDATAEEPNRIRIETGHNGDADRDDQEVGMFEVRLSTEAMPERPEQPGDGEG